MARSGVLLTSWLVMHLMPTSLIKMLSSSIAKAPPDRYTLIATCKTNSLVGVNHTILEYAQVWSAKPEYGVIGEPVFVPRHHSSASTKDGIHSRTSTGHEGKKAHGDIMPYDKDEDNGWVITQVYNCKTHKTDFVVLDARNLAAGPIARVKLGHHTPYGFHGTFTPDVFL